MHEPTPAPVLPRCVAVIGAGTMGGGIATVLAQHGFAVRLFDPSRAALERAEARVRKRAADADLVTTEELAEVARGCELAIEAVPEALGLKRDVFAVLFARRPPAA